MIISCNPNIIHFKYNCVLITRFMHFKQADTQAQRKGKGKAGERLEKAAELLMGCFRVCASDK